MYHRNPLILFLIIVSFGALTSCSQTQYAAHVVKQIPMPGDRPESTGIYKVGTPYTIKNRQYYPAETFNHTEIGIASWYGPNFHGKLTANGEIFDKNELTAAHRTLQLPSIIRVTNMQNGRSLYLRVNDRGPFANDRVLDVSERAASLLGFKNQGTTKVKIEVIPDASREVANLAKAGHDTGGYEVAMNRNKMTPRTRSIVESTNTLENEGFVVPQGKPVPPVTQITLTEPGRGVTTPQRKPVEGQRQRVYMPEPTSAPVPASFDGRIFVQAGSFSLEQNALNYSNQLSSLAPSKVYLARVDNSPFYRVRLGPFASRAQADTILAQLQQGGNSNAVIVID